MCSYDVLLSYCRQATVHSAAHEVLTSSRHNQSLVGLSHVFSIQTVELPAIREHGFLACFIHVQAVGRRLCRSDCERTLDTPSISPSEGLRQSV